MHAVVLVVRPYISSQKILHYILLNNKNESYIRKDKNKMKDRVTREEKCCCLMPSLMITKSVK